MKKITFLLALMSAVTLYRAQGLQGIIVEKYYLSNAADSINAATNGAVSPLRKGSVTYRVYVDMAPGYQFLQIYGVPDALGNVIHPLVIKTTTDFYNDPTYGQIYPQNTSTVNTRKHTTLIDSWLSVGGVCAGKMGVLKTEDTDGSIGNANGILTNTLGGIYGAPINSVVPNAADGMLPGSPLAPTALGIGSAADVFDQTPGSVFTCSSCGVAALGGVVGTTTTNMVLVGQFTTKGIFSFSLNVQITPTANPSADEKYVPNNPQTGEIVFPSLIYTSATTPTVTEPVDTTDVGIDSKINEFQQFSIYPNPSHDVFKLNASTFGKIPAGTYSVFDATGRLVVSRKIDESTEGKIDEIIDLSGFANGLYVVKLSFEGYMKTSKIVKE